MTIKILTNRPNSYTSVPSRVTLTGADVAACSDIVELSATRTRFLTGAGHLIIDFAGFDNLVPFHYMIGAVGALLHGRLVKLSTVGLDEFPIDLPMHEEERAALRAALEDGRLRMFREPDDLRRDLG